MLYKTSNFLTNYFIKNNIISPNNKELYIYGFQLILSTLSSMLTILLTATFINISYGILFLLFFIPIRFYAGGYHASSYLKCFIYTNSLFIITLALSLIVYIYGLLPYYYLFIIAGIIYFWINTPCINQNNPLSYTYLLKNRFISRKILILYFIVIILTYQINHFLFILEINTLFLVTILFICGNLKYIMSEN